MVICVCRGSGDGQCWREPDQGIAGRNSSADDEKERDPPGTFLCLGSGPTSGRWLVPNQDLVLVLVLEPHRTR